MRRLRFCLARLTPTQHFAARNVRGGQDLGDALQPAEAVAGAGGRGDENLFGGCWVGAFELAFGGGGFGGRDMGVSPRITKEQLLCSSISLKDLPSPDHVGTFGFQRPRSESG